MIGRSAVCELVVLKSIFSLFRRVNSFLQERIIDDKNALEPIIFAWRKELAYRNKEKSDFNTTTRSQTIDLPISVGSNLLKLYRNPENVKFVLDAQFGATNELMGTSYGSRHVKPEYIFAGKTGTSQIRRITEEERELKLKQKDLPYERRDHALFTAFAPYKNPRYALSVLIEHGGTGSSIAAPIAKKIIKKVIDRHQLRKKYQQDLFQEI